MTRLFALHSAYGLATAAAAIDAGLLETGTDRDGRTVERVLVPFTSSRVPETVVGIDADPALHSLRARFDRVEPLADVLGPLHPSAWQPTETDLPVMGRLLTRAWNLDPRELELFVQSPQVAPARTLLSLFPEARVTIVGDGLMTYAPMRVRLPHAVSARIERVVYADVVPGVRPLVAAPYAAPAPVPPDWFAAALRETGGAETGVAAGPATVLVLGQYLSALGLMTPAEELALQQRLIDRAGAERPERIVFKPHPAAPPQLVGAVRAHAERRGLSFVEDRSRLPAELLAERLDARAVVATFSTALPTVHTLFGRRIGAAGTVDLLRTLAPVENSNRVPLVIVDALTRPHAPYADPDRLQLLLDAVGYTMQPEIAGHLRPRAEELLQDLDDEERCRYFSAERLGALGLSGGRGPTGVRGLLTPRGGVGRIEEWRLTAVGARRRVGRAWREIRGR
ncbi:polysialyltransferase family glycosyltransferase [Zhihengliuella sp. ISTPL4]|uniref:polysialyltransferase family glycosyltransferase n=1 Tax=Zhihengliuella sp. ISTPL4 TaxID=2058657 RepID=UPI000C7968F0|nr:polysialyltransferase family glycosyltransferase [Zhihengliuella sp. ISTPL4]